MPLIQITTGRETFPGYTTSINAYYRLTGSAVEQPLDVAARDSGVRAKRIGSSSAPASDRNTNHGFWSDSRFELPEGSCLRVVKLYRNPATSGFGYQDCQVLLRMRDGAALRRIRYPLCGHAFASRTAAYVEGRFDILSEDQLEALNVTLRKSEQGTMADLDDPDMLSVEILERELVPLSIAPAVVVGGGDKPKTTFTTARVRVIRGTPRS